MRNSIRFRWRDVREQLGRRLDPAAVSADWTSRGTTENAVDCRTFGHRSRSRLLSPRTVIADTDAIGQVRRRCTAGPAPTLHVGVIMDGNGRWAEARGLGPLAGPCPRRAARDRDRHGLPRPRRHPPHALRVLHRELAASPGRGRGADADLPPVHPRTRWTGSARNDVRVRFIGMRHRVPPRLRGLMEALEERTARLPRAEPLDRHRLRRARRTDARGSRAFARGRGRAVVAGGDLGGGDRRRRSTPAPSRTRTSSSVPRASFASRTSCSGREPTPSTIFRRPRGRISPPVISLRPSMRSACGGVGSAAPTRPRPCRRGRTGVWPEPPAARCGLNS